MEDLRQQIIDILFENGFVNMTGNAYEQAEKIMGLISNKTPVAEVPCGDGLCAKELHLAREWFDVVQDISPTYLKRKDYLLAKKIYEKLNFRVPNSIVDGCA